MRWAGSKRKQLARLRAYWSTGHSGYVEPFAGSACLFFSLNPPRAVLGDTNVELIELYEVVRDAPTDIYRQLLNIERNANTYRRWRALDPKQLDCRTRAVRFLYLNRNCFNGIYRTNSDGRFNVPMGSKLSAYFTEHDLVRCSQLLQSATLVAGDYKSTLKRVKAGDFVYLDPPYAVDSRRVFREYGKDVFTTADMKAFGEGLQRIVDTKADFLVSYADCKEARALARKWNSARLTVHRHVAGFAGARRNTYEWLITNLPIKRPSDVDHA